MNLAEALDMHARARPHHPAVISGDVTLTHAEFAERVRTAAGKLAGRGLGKGDLVGLCLRDSIDHLVLIYALARRGIVTLPMDWRWSTPEKERVAGHFGATLVFAEPDAEPIPGIDCKPASALDAVAPGSAADCAVVSEPDLPLLLSISSGTTGRPKGPRITHAHMLRRFWTHWINLRLNSADRYVSATPLYFGGGRAFAMSMLFCGGTVILFPPPFKPEDLSAELDRVDATGTFLVPTQLRRLLELSDDLKTPFRRLNVLMSSGAPLTADERNAIREGLCGQFVEYYGSTEGGGISYSAPEIQKRYPDSVGWPVFAVDIEVVDDEHRSLPAGSVGRLRYRGPGVADGFYLDDEASADAFRDGWFYPGDLAEINEEGCVFLRGRLKDMIIRGGVNVYPLEIETTLTAHPAVSEAAVVGRPSQDLGEDVAAFVILRAAIEPADLIAWCKERLAPYKVPREILVVDQFPRNSSGKTLKTDLVARLDPR